MSAHLLLHPAFDITEAATGVADGEVVHPAAQNRIDELHHPPHRLRVEAPEDVLELAQQCGALLELGRIVRSPLALKTPHASELKAQESEAFSLRQVNAATLIGVDLDLEFGQFPSQPPLSCFEQPVVSRVGVHQNHEIVGEPCVLYISIGSVAGDLP